MYLHFSPMQNKSGLLVYHHKELTLNLLVLPKMWRPKGELTNPWKYKEDTLNVIAYEGERHHVKLPEGATPDIKKRWNDWKDLLKECCDTLSSKAKIEDSEDHLLDKETLKSLSGLMSTISKPKKDLLTKFSEETNKSDFSQQVENLFKLALFSSTRNNFDINIFQSNDDHVVALTDDSTIQNDSPIFRMLAIENFLSEIETHLHKIHQGYLKTTEQLDTIRGSVTGTSLMMLDAGVSLKPRCRYNKFVPNIPLYQVLVTTLDAIYRGWCLPNDPILKHLDIVEKTKTRARRLRTKLQHITSLPLDVARNTCQRLHLNRLQQFWKPSINLSKILLRNKPVFMNQSVSGSGGYMWLVNTAAVWESILAQGLRKQKNLSVETKNVALPHPWKNDGKSNLGGKPKMDIKAINNTNHDILILDAKYKIKRNKDGELKRKGSVKNEQYQMFTYSHLITQEKTTVHVSLIYPWDKTSRPERDIYQRFSFNNNQKCTLSLCHVPFPSCSNSSTANDVLSKGSWEAYIKSEVLPTLRSELQDITKPQQ